MAKLDDQLKTVTDLLGTIGTEVDKISTDTDTLQAQIAALQAAQGTLTPEQQAALDSIVVTATGISEKVAALDAKVPDPTV